MKFLKQQSESSVTRGEVTCLHKEIKVGWNVTFVLLKFKTHAYPCYCISPRSPDIKQMLKSFVVDGSGKFTRLCGKETCEGKRSCVFVDARQTVNGSTPYNVKTV